jgi:hypothetical protein
MGIRPHLIFMCGVNDLETDPKDPWTITDKRWRGSQYEQEDQIPLPPGPLQDKWRTQKGWRDMNQIIYFRDTKFYEALVYNCEYGLPNVMGLNLGSIYDHNVLWAMAAIEYAEKNESLPGVIVIPSLPMEDDMSEGASIMKAVNRYREKGEPVPERLKKMARRSGDKIRAVKFGWNIATMSFIAPMWADYAIYLLRQWGLFVCSRDMKFMLYFYWS